MNIPDIIGWVGNIGFFLGAILLAKKRSGGFYWQIEGNFFYLIQAIMTGMWSLSILSFILIFINIGGIINWKKLKRTKIE